MAEEEGEEEAAAEIAANEETMEATDDKTTYLETIGEEQYEGGEYEGDEDEERDEVQSAEANEDDKGIMIDDDEMHTALIDEDEQPNLLIDTDDNYEIAESDQHPVSEVKLEEEIEETEPKVAARGSVTFQDTEEENEEIDEETLKLRGSLPFATSNVYITRSALLKRRKAIPRVREDDRMTRISGDFKALDLEKLQRIAQIHMRKRYGEGGEGFYDYYSDESESEQDKENISEDEKVKALDREYYYELHKKLLLERNTNRIKNNFLHRKMAEHFRKRKLEHFLNETDQQVDTIQRYNKRLDILGELLNVYNFQKESIGIELENMEQQRNERFALVTDTFAKLQNREKEIGTGLINTKTGKEISDKHVDRLIRRQAHEAQVVAELRLKYIKIRNLVNEKQTEMHRLDEIAPGLYLIDYEQLKVENQSHSDKIEERDEELTRLRTRCQNAVECLAHIREKCFAYEVDIQKLSDHQLEVDNDCAEARERVNFFKIERDNYRILTDKLSEEAGLLTKPKLLLDMEDSIEEIKKTKEELQKLQEEYEKRQIYLVAIRKNMESLNTKVQTIMKPQTQPRKSHIVELNRKESTNRKPKVYRGRPTLLKPILPLEDDIWQI